MAEPYGAPPGYPPGQPPGYPPGYRQVPAYGPPRRRRRRWPWVLLVVLLVLFGLFVAADRIAANVVEDRAADVLQSSQNLPNRPDVSIGGFPFLTQLATRRFNDVTVSDDEVPLPSGITLDNVVVHLSDVRISSDYSTLSAPRATADALISYPMLSQALGFRVTGANGRLRARPRVTVAGHNFTAPVSAAVTTRGDQLAFIDVRVGGVPLPGVAAAQFTRIFHTAIALARLPFHVQLTGAVVGESGVDLQLTGHNITYQR